ncbi:MAG: hypothetical protein H6679_00600 [Epsilonproteobacteria bacterium]|nr:hypothetical protein [Campylobacterota bacterium]
MKFLLSCTFAFLCYLQLTAADNTHLDYVELSDYVPYNADDDIALPNPLLKDERQRHDKTKLKKYTHALKNLLDEEDKAKQHTKKGSKNNHKHLTVKEESSKNGHLPQAIRDYISTVYQHKDLASKKISLKFSNTSLHDAMALIADQSDLQFIIDADIKGTIGNVVLENVTLSDALRSLCNSMNPKLAPLKEGDIWRITQEQELIEQFKSKRQADHERNYSQTTITIKYAKWNEHFKKRIKKLWEGITQTNKEFEGTYLVFDDYSRKLLCRAHTPHVRQFEQYIKEIDIAHPQIKIDVRVVLANKDFDQSFGIQWSGVYNRRASVKNTSFVGLGPITSNDKSDTDCFTKSHDYFKDLITWTLNFIPENLTPTIKIPFVWGNKDLATKRLNLFLNAAENRNEIRTILKPSLLVDNDEMAEILVGEELPHEVRLDEAVEGKLTNVTTVNYKAIGMKIKVKPTVCPDHQSVFLDIYVENSSVIKPQIQLERSVDDKKTSFNYTIQTARSKNKVLLKNAQTTMISGLISNAKERNASGIPFLRQIPILGDLIFGGRQKINIDKELLIFITPEIVYV